MKNKLILTIMICFFAGKLSAQKTLPINTSSSAMKWTGHAELGSYAPSGTLQFKEGSITLKGKSVVKALILIDMKSMKQDNDHLLEHLKSADFFDVDQFPNSTITIEKVVNNIAYGKLTIKDKTLPFQCPILMVNRGNAILVTGKAIIDRTIYGIIYNSGNFFSGLGDKAIGNTFDIEFSVLASVNR